MPGKESALLINDCKLSSHGSLKGTFLSLFVIGEDEDEEGINTELEKEERKEDLW